jgi:tRNA threonylcarbamoyl adenosine modification protein YeaZ
MHYLLLDTSSSLGLIALLKDKEILGSQFLPSLELSSNLMPTIQKLLQESGIEISSLSFIAIGIGPGSFTGTRIGVVVAKALSFGLNLAAIPFCSLLSFMPQTDLETFHIISDAKSGLVYDLKIETKFLHNLHSIKPRLESAEILGLDKPYFSADETLCVKTPHLLTTSFNLPFLVDYILNEYRHERFVKAADLQPLYLKAP